MLSGATGIDFGLNNNEVLAAAAGILQDKGDAGGSIGKYVIIDYGNGWSTRYWHLSSIDPEILNMANGTSIPQGKLLGISGACPGCGPHLHLEIRYNNSSTGITWHGQVIDGYVVRAMVLQADGSKILNYQGTLTKGSESQQNINYSFCNNAAVIRWSGSNETVEAGSSQTLTSTNVKAQSGGGSCGITSIPSGYNQCAEEGGFCSFSGTANVIYGANSCYTSPRSFSNGTACNNDVFGDPLPGVHKYCYTNGSGSSGSWAYQLFDLGDYNGDKYESNQTITDLSTVGWNDRAESIKINSGYEIIACEHANFQGNCGRATGPAQFSDINALAQGLRNGLSSIKVCAGSCPNPPSANFDASPQSGTAPLVTTFHIVDTSNITSCSWNYGDGQTGTSCASYHTHTYTRVCYELLPGSGKLQAWNEKHIRVM